MHPHSSDLIFISVGITFYLTVKPNCHFESPIHRGEKSPNSSTIGFLLFHKAESSK